MEYITVPLSIILGSLPIIIIMYIQKINGDWL